MKNRLKCDVVCLATRQPDAVLLIPNSPHRMPYHTLEDGLAWQNSDRYHMGHLYLTSDREIQQGDWIYETTGQRIGLYNYDQENDTHDLVIGDIDYPFISSEYFRKIEATTNPELWYDDFNRIVAGWARVGMVPRIPFSFIQEYAQSQGKIKQVYLETESKLQPEIPIIEIIRTNEDNTVIIHRVKECWSREELKEEMAHLALIAFAHEHKEGLWNPEDFNKWFEDSY